MKVRKKKEKINVEFEFYGEFATAISTLNELDLHSILSGELNVLALLSLEKFIKDSNELIVEMNIEDNKEC